MKAVRSALQASNVLRCYNNLSYVNRVSITDRILVSTTVLVESRRNAGHSKWANIRHVKGLKDEQKSKETARYIQKLQVAIKEGGGSPDPKVNVKLASIIEDGKAAKIPNATIQAALGRAKTKPEGRNEQWTLKGPGRSLLLLDVLTDNKNLTKSELNTLVRKTGATWGDDGCFRQFSSEGKIMCAQLKNNAITEELLDSAMNDAIECGAGDVSVEDDEEHGKVLVFDVEPLELVKVKSKLKSLGYEVVFSEVVFSPISLVKLTEDEMKVLEVMRNKFFNNSSVMNIYDNVDEER